ADHGALQKQLDHGHRWPVPIKKSELRVEHEPSLPLTAVPVQKLGAICFDPYPQPTGIAGCPNVGGAQLAPYVRTSFDMEIALHWSTTWTEKPTDLAALLDRLGRHV
ncbi:MAG TPA: hypothetical protein VFI55_16070, partial [Mycobacterium sp.]|nr:hypothetical protein [Mycobacterium sp.]